EPARRMGYEFEDQALIDEMVGAVVDSSSALALLSFTAAWMWDLRDRQFRKLRRKVYASIGGVGGALAQHAEDVIVKMTVAERELVREAFRLLVTADGTRAVIARTELVDALGGGTQATNVIESLVQARLVVTTEASTGITIEITHEALLDSWPRLVGWRRDDAENARMRDQLRTSARQWESRDRQRGLLWRGDVLAEYRLWRARYRGRLTELEEMFTAACLREDARASRRRRGLLAGAFVVLVACSAVLYVFAQRARKNAREATARELEVLEEQGRRELLDNHPIHAAAPLAKAYDLGDGRPALRFLLARALAVGEARGPELRGHTDSVGRAAFSADGTRVVTVSRDHTMRLWDAATGGQLASITLAAPPLLARMPDSTAVALAVGDEVGLRRSSDLGVIAHWKLPGKAEASAIAVGDDSRVIVGDTKGNLYVLERERAPHPLALHKGRVFSVAVAGQDWAAGGADGRVSISAGGGAPRVVVHGDQPIYAVALAGGHVASAGGDATVKVWATETARLERELVGHASAVRGLAFSPDGARLASASEDGTARLWTIASDHPPVVLNGHDGALVSVAFTRDGSQLVTTGIDATARVWDGVSGSPRVTLDGHHAEVWSAAFDARGERLVTASYDGTARIWNLQRGDRRIAQITPNGFNSVEYSQRGDRMIAGGSDGIARVFRADGTPVAELTCGAPVRAVALSPDGTRAATGTESGVMRLWDVEGKRVIGELGSVPDGAYVARYRPDGAELAIGGADGVVHVFDAKTGAPIAKLEGHHDGVWGLAYSDDGSLLATSSDDKTIRIIDSDRKLVHAIGPLSAEVNSVAFDPSGRHLAAVSSDGMLRVFRVDTGEVVVERAAHHANVATVAYSRDGERIATASFDHTIIIWDARALRELARLEHHTEPVLGAQFQPGADRLVDTSFDGTLWLVDLPLEQRPPDVVDRAASP
ncbi:MAG TPA: hypothetical protein VMJ10_37825, partial [Kofleriaceae bacterium]|nr:hypothetical protein [Kofleriaceae bacterium]